MKYKFRVIHIFYVLAVIISAANAYSDRYGFSGSQFVGHLVIWWFLVWVADKIDTKFRKKPAIDEKNDDQSSVE